MSNTAANKVVLYNFDKRGGKILYDRLTRMYQEKGNNIAIFQPRGMLKMLRLHMKHLNLCLVHFTDMTRTIYSTSTIPMCLYLKNMKEKYRIV